ncbi:MAG: FAD-dependent oxidoreductase [Actinobacteria bacterium]|nr:FAD-dependent oxidoreductase [Actinomycetota bacterium]MCB9411743.1 FAD-dependent oxidoreductase [Actinomycetota bacterium]
MTRIVVIGGDAAGASAASGIKRRQPEWDVVMLERSRYTSYAACGLPYWVAGQIPEEQMLIARSPEQHRANGIDVRLDNEVIGLDAAANTVTVSESGTESIMEYDQLVIATGAAPIRPPIPGADAANVHQVHTIPGTKALVEALAAADATPERVVIVGAGFIGIEMAEAFNDHDVPVTIVEQASYPMASLDDDMGEAIRDRMIAEGIDLALGQRVEAIETDSAGLARAVRTDAESFAADLVVLALGVRPNTGFARAADLPVGDSGGLLTDRRQRVLGQANIWAAGDCVQTYHRLLRRTVHMPLGTHANKQGRVVGLNIGGVYATFPGIIGTAITKVGSTHIGRTGLSTDQAIEAGFDVVSATVRTSVIAGYMPDAGAMRTKVIAEVGTGRLLGGQIVGNQVGAAKRIDTLAMAIWTHQTAADLTGADLAYAPPSSPVWDPVQVAARSVSGKL